MRLPGHNPWLRRGVCRRVLTLVSAVAASAAVSAGAQQPAPPSEGQQVQRPPVDTAPPAALAFQGTTVIDVETGRRVPGQTIVAVGNRIRAVGPTGRTSLPAGTRVLKADGTFAIPGLWDMHTHVMGYPNTFFPLLLANGVTGIRDMATPFLDSMVRWRREIAEGRRAGPRIVTTGPSITSKEQVARSTASIGNRFAFHMIGADTPEEGRRIVDSLKQGGADLIKVYTRLERDVYFAILAEARRVGLPVAGHLPDSISVYEALDSGQQSFEHGFGMLPCVEVRTASGVATPDVQECRAIAAAMRRRDAWVMPGPVVNPPALCASCQLPWFREQDRYWPDSLHDAFGRRPDAPPHEPEARSLGLEQWAAMHTGPASLKIARDAGIRFIAGTDGSPVGFTSWQRPGFALQEQIWDMTHAGLTPLEALQAATLNPARYFHATDSMGTVAPGKVADFVLLDADPLVDIFNTRRIRAVIADGRFYDRADLDSLLIGVERLARQSRRP